MVERLEFNIKVLIVAHLEVLNALSSDELTIVEVHLTEVLTHRAEHLQRGVREERAIVHGQSLELLGTAKTSHETRDALIGDLITVRQHEGVNSRAKGSELDQCGIGHLGTVLQIEFLQLKEKKRRFI